jgi:predicted DsbA family dithiol-disulfide isomerase
MEKPLEVEVYVDYVCPYAYAGALWMRDVAEQLDGKLKVVWRYFSLEQVNSDLGPEWKVWEQPVSHSTKGFDGFRGAIAAQQQGDTAWEKFHFAWMDARHGEKRRASPHAVAEAIGLDMEKFTRDFDDPTLWRKLADDHERGANEFGVFGTPTFVFPNGESAYLQVRPAPPAEQALAFWQDFEEVVVGRPTIFEIKRPKKPVRE